MLAQYALIQITKEVYMQNSNDLIQVYSKRVAFELRKLGYKIVGTTPNEKFPMFDIFLFKNEGNVKEDLKKFTGK
jgi:hypothetical protein